MKIYPQSAVKKELLLMFGIKKISGVEWIIAGLGNPEKKYEGTRHNVGFKALSKIAQKYADNPSATKMKFKASVLTVTISGAKCLLMQPLTYMNLSGEAIAEAAAFYKIPPERIIVICDDISFEPGVLRIRRNGSAGGHNGLKSIIALLKSENFPRIKLGVGKKPAEYDLADWVLSKLPKDDALKLEECAGKCPDIVEYIVGGEFETAMNKFN